MAKRPIKQIKELVGLGRLAEAISLYSESFWGKAAIILSYRFHSISKRFRSGLLTFEKYTIEVNKIADVLLEDILLFETNLKKNLADVNILLKFIKIC